MNNDDLLKFYSAFAMMAYIIRQDPEDTEVDIAHQSLTMAAYMVEAIDQSDLFD